MLRTALRIGAALALTAAPALSQQTYIFSTSTSQVQPSNVGTITLTQVGANMVNVFVDLLDGYGFVNTGGDHTPFAFNLTSEAGLSAVFTSPAGGTYTSGMFSLNTAGGANTPYGTYGVAIDNSAGNGSGSAYYGDLAFTLTGTGLTTNSFVANTDGYYFSADLTDGRNTGAVAWSGRVGGGGQGSVVPEPSTYVLLASGMIGLVGVARRRKQQG
jgi:hypothetical protein